MRMNGPLRVPKKVRLGVTDWGRCERDAAYARCAFRGANILQEDRPWTS
jgi:hypothetical protein